MTTKERERIFAIVGALCLAFLLGDRVVLSPLHNAWARRSEQITKLGQSLDKGRILMERENAVLGTWDGMKQHALPPDPSSAENEILKSVDRWAVESGLKVTSLRPEWTQPENPKNDFVELKCYIAAGGDLESISQFLYAMERDPLALKVDEIEMTARNSLGRELSLSVRLSGLVLLKEVQ
jgi:Tfp pilus assembly protein PilO